MKEIESRETQQEFFVEFAKETKKPERFTSISRTQKPIFLSVSVEQALLAGILAILICCLMFFLGIVRGKALIPPEPASVAAVQNIQKPSAVLSAAAVEVPRPELKPPPNKISFKPDPTKPYTIQLVTYKKKDLAEKEVNALKKSGFYSFIIPSGDYYQVCVGQYISKENAGKDLKTVGVKYKDCFLRRR